MVTYDELYQFLKARYKHSRFEGRNGNGWDSDYSHIVARGDYAALQERGYSMISRHEAANGEGCTYDHNLNILTGTPGINGNPPLEDWPLKQTEQEPS